MTKRLSSLFVVSSAFLLSISFSACSSTDGPSSMGGAGAPPTTAGNSSAAGTVGTAGTPGTAGTGGAPGTSGAGPTGGNATTAGAGGAATTAGAGGMSGAGGSAPAGVASSGCMKDPQATDSASAWVKHDIDVTGVDAAFITKYPPNVGTQYSWTHRNYYMKLPANYDSTKQYPIAIGGSGCGGPETVGAEGGYSVLGSVQNQDQAILVSLSYVLSSAANSSCGGGGAVFADDFVNSPEVQYVAAVVKDVQSKYCNNTHKVFLSGYSSGAFEAISMGCADSDILRGFGVQIGGGLRIGGPKPCKGPVAAIYVVGTQDTDNPITSATPLNDSLGSAPSRDEVLMRNGCVGTETKMWDPAYPNCVTYTGCPAPYPVVWCPIESGHNPMPNDAAVGKYRYDGIWKFWSTLPDK